MDIFHVIDFIKLTECNNFSQAADELYISQSSLSKHIQSLESILGVELFDRNTRKISLSEGGRVFLPYAKELEKTFLDASRKLQYLISKKQMELKIGCIPIMAVYDIVDVLSEFEAENHSVNIELIECRYNHYKEIVEHLLDFQYELVFCDSFCIKSKRIEKIDYCNDQLVVVMHKSHALASLNIIDLKLLSGEKLLLMNKNTPTGQLSFSICKKAGLMPNVWFWGTRFEDIFDLVAKNMGISLLMKKFVKSSFNKDIVIRDIYPTAERSICLARIANHDHSEIANKFWNYLSQRFANLRISPNAEGCEVC
jgi:DNA-binding transcriptional LysR family regulator